MAAFTPGPWKASDHNFAMVLNEKGLAIAGLMTSGRDIEEVKSNSRLISAAPDLYEACKEALYYVDDPYLDTHTRLRQAIAKVEGKS